MGHPSFSPLLLTILPWHAHSQLPLHHSQQHLILPTKLHLISLLSSRVVSDSLVNPLALLPLPSISLIAALLTSEEISLHYLTIYLTNKPASDSFPNASYKNYLISSLQTSSFTYLLTILTHPGKMEWPTHLQRQLCHQMVLFLTPHHPGLPQVCHPTQSTWPTSWWSWSTLPTHTSCPRFCHHNGVRLQECSPRVPHSQEPPQLLHAPDPWRII